MGEQKRLMICGDCGHARLFAIQNNDKIAPVFFRPCREVHPAEKGARHILFLIRELLDFTPEHTGTDISLALRYMTDALKSGATTFLISDFIDSGRLLSDSVHCQQQA